MDSEQLPGAILLILICVVAAMGLWYLGIRRGSLKAKQFAVMIGILPVLAIGIEVARPWLESVPEYRTVAQGPSRREESAASEVMIPVTNATVMHQIELTPKIRGDKPPSEPIHLKFQVRAPDGEVLVQEERDAAPATGLKWATLLVQFRPRADGEHSLKLEIPQPATRVDILVRELRK